MPNRDNIFYIYIYIYICSNTPTVASHYYNYIYIIGHLFFSGIILCTLQAHKAFYLLDFHQVFMGLHGDLAWILKKYI